MGRVTGRRGDGGRRPEGRQVVESLGLLAGRRPRRSMGSWFRRVFTDCQRSLLRLLNVPPALSPGTIEREICKGRRSLLRFRTGLCPNRWPQTALPPLLPLPGLLCRHRKRDSGPEQTETPAEGAATIPISANRRRHGSDPRGVRVDGPKESPATRPVVCWTRRPE